MHPIAFSNKLLPCDVTRAVVRNTPLVMWRGKDAVTCLPDVCSHRGAQLSRGKITDAATIQCPYHGWEFDQRGTCVRVPQARKDQYIPKACHLRPWRVVESHGIVWVAPPASKASKAPAAPATPTLHEMLEASRITERVQGFNAREHFVTDYTLDANYSAELQIENLLDPAHIHFVHNGFQGDEAKAGHIEAMDVTVDHANKILRGVFRHTGRTDIPVIDITYHWPSLVDVSIKDPQTLHTVRKNIIYVTPSTDTTCRVLFRDVAFKKYLVPDAGPLSFAHLLLGAPSIANTYQVVNETVVEAIMTQDIDILESQQANVSVAGTAVAPPYGQKYMLLTESDRLILEYRKVMKQWCV